MNKIEIGDIVSHKFILLDDDLGMTVIEVNSQKALCGYFGGAESVYVETWFLKEDLEIIQKVDTIYMGV